MLYNRAWFKKDTYGLTIGGGQINNPGRYLVLLPPINGETAPSAAITHPTLQGIPGTHSKLGIRRSPSITCPGSGSRFVGSMTTDTPVCRIGLAAVELRRLVPWKCPVPTTGLPNSLPATTGIRPGH